MPEHRLNQHTTFRLLAAAVGVIFLAVGVVGVLLLVNSANDDATDAANDDDRAKIRAYYDERIDDLQTIVTEQREQFLACRDEPKKSPACGEPVAPEVPTAPATALAVTQAQIFSVLLVYCEPLNGCVGERGEPGKPGTDGADAPPPTMQQLIDAVAAYCSTRDECRGPKGDKGDPGDDGDPAPTPEPTLAPTPEGDTDG